MPLFSGTRYGMIILMIPLHKRGVATAGNSNLHMFRAEKTNEFYTQLSMIEDEVTNKKASTPMFLPERKSLSQSSGFYHSTEAGGL